MALVGVSPIPMEVRSSPEVLTREVTHRPWQVLQGDRDSRELRASLPGLGGALGPRVQVELLLTLVLVACVDGVVVPLLGLGRQGLSLLGTFSLATWVLSVAPLPPI